MKLHMKNPDLFIDSLSYEKERIKIIVARDGLIRAMDFVEQTHKIYRRCRKIGHASENTYRRTFIQSCVDFRKIMRYFETYQDYLTKVGQLKPKPKQPVIEVPIVAPNLEQDISDEHKDRIVALYEDPNFCCYTDEEMKRLVESSRTITPDDPSYSFRMPHVPLTEQEKQQYLDAINDTFVEKP